MGPARQIVLVVEDEPLLRMEALDLIEEAGFDTVEATDATAAIAVLEKRPDITIVFTDIDMPRGIDGMKFAAVIRDRWPPIEIVVVSGKQMPSHVELPVRSVFFSKPYKHDEIVGALHKFAH